MRRGGWVGAGREDSPLASAVLPAALHDMPAGRRHVAEVHHSTSNAAQQHTVAATQPPAQAKPRMPPAAVHLPVVGPRAEQQAGGTPGGPQVPAVVQRQPGGWVIDQRRCRCFQLAVPQLLSMAGEEGQTLGKSTHSWNSCHVFSSSSDGQCPDDRDSCAAAIWPPNNTSATRLPTHLLNACRPRPAGVHNQQHCITRPRQPTPAPTYHQQTASRTCPMSADRVQPGLTTSSVCPGSSGAAPNSPAHRRAKGAKLRLPTCAGQESRPWSILR